jgi:hypothetical protein
MRHLSDVSYIKFHKSSGLFLDPSSHNSTTVKRFVAAVAAVVAHGLSAQALRSLPLPSICNLQLLLDNIRAKAVYKGPVHR